MSKVEFAKIDWTVFPAGYFGAILDGVTLRGATYRVNAGFLRTEKGEITLRPDSYTERGAPSNRYFYAVSVTRVDKYLEEPSRAAKEAITEFVLGLAKAYAAENPRAFEAAELAGRRSRLDDVESEIRELEKKLRLLRPEKARLVAEIRRREAALAESAPKAEAAE